MSPRSSGYVVAPVDRDPAAAATTPRPARSSCTGRGSRSRRRSPRASERPRGRARSGASHGDRRPRRRARRLGPRDPGRLRRRSPSPRCPFLQLWAPRADRRRRKHARDRGAATCPSPNRLPRRPRASGRGDPSAPLQPAPAPRPGYALVRILGLHRGHRARRRASSPAPSAIGDHDGRVEPRRLSRRESPGARTGSAERAICRAGVAPSSTPTPEHSRRRSTGGGPPGRIRSVGTRIGIRAAPL